MILVAGATGVLGGMIAQRLLQVGEDVRILVRPNSPSEELAKRGMATSARSLIEMGAKPVCGDLKDPASLGPACEGIEAVITTANSARRGGEDNVQAVDLEGNRNLVEAAAGVERFVFTSALDARANHPVPFLQAKARTEERLRAGDMPFTILAPAIFMGAWLVRIVSGPLRAGQPITLVGKGRRKHSFISIEDVATFATAAMGHPAAVDRYLALGGPEALSWLDVVATCGRVVGRELPVQYAAPGDPASGLPEAIAALLAALESHDSVVDMTETVRIFGVELTPLEVVAGRLFGDRAS